MSMQAEEAQDEEEIGDIAKVPACSVWNEARSSSSLT